MNNDFAHYLSTSVDDLRSTLGCELANMSPAALPDSIAFHEGLLMACPKKEKTKWQLIERHIRALRKLEASLKGKGQMADGKSAQKGQSPSKKGGKPLTIAEFENLGPDTSLAEQPGTRFALVNQYHDLAKASMAQSCAYMILAGVELLALKKDAEHGTWEAMFAKDSKGKSTNDCRFEFTVSTAKNYMRLGDAAKKNVPALRELCATDKPLALMSAEDREKIVQVVKKAGDGNTYKELAQQWGLVKKPPGNGGGDQGGGGAEDPLTPEQAAERAAQDLFHPLALSLFQGCTEGEKQKLFSLPITSDKPGDVTGLADLRDHVSAFLALVDQVLEEKKKAVRKSK